MTAEASPGNWNGTRGAGRRPKVSYPGFRAPPGRLLHFNVPDIWDHLSGRETTLDNCAPPLLTVIIDHKRFADVVRLRARSLTP